jgi:hypothetical protein
MRESSSRSNSSMSMLPTLAAQLSNVTAEKSNRESVASSYTVKRGFAASASSR